VRTSLAACTLVACAQGTAPIGTAESTTGAWEPAPILESLVTPRPVLAEGAVEPALDVRVVRLAPEDTAGTERFCDLAHVGGLQELGVPTHRYGLAAEEEDAPAPAITHRVLVRCQAPTGRAWADLVLRKENAGLAQFLERGTRVRVRVLGTHGFDGHVALELLAVLGDSPPIVPEPVREVPAGADFGALAAREVLESQRPCAVSWAGHVEPVEGEGYPATASHHLPVVCRHVGGEAWVDVVFTRGDAVRALWIRRGEVVPLALLSAGGGAGEHPVARYEGPT